MRKFSTFFPQIKKKVFLSNEKKKNSRFLTRIRFFFAEKNFLLFICCFLLFFFVFFEVKEEVACELLCDFFLFFSSLTKESLLNFGLILFIFLLPFFELKEGVASELWFNFAQKRKLAFGLMFSFSSVMKRKVVRGLGDRLNLGLICLLCRSARISF